MLKPEFIEVQYRMGSQSWEMETKSQRHILTSQVLLVITLHRMGKYYYILDQQLNFRGRASGHSLVENINARFTKSFLKLSVP